MNDILRFAAFVAICHLGAVGASVVVTAGVSTTALTVMCAALIAAAIVYDHMNGLPARGETDAP